MASCGGQSPPSSIPGIHDLHTCHESHILSDMCPHFFQPDIVVTLQDYSPTFKYLETTDTVMTLVLLCAILEGTTRLTRSRPSMQFAAGCMHWICSPWPQMSSIAYSMHCVQPQSGTASIGGCRKQSTKLSFLQVAIFKCCVEQLVSFKYCCLAVLPECPVLHWECKQGGATQMLSPDMQAQSLLKLVSETRSFYIIFG